MKPQADWTQADWLAFNDGWSYQRLGYPVRTTQDQNLFRMGMACAEEERIDDPSSAVQ